MLNFAGTGSRILLPAVSSCRRVKPSRKIASNSNGEVNCRELARRPCLIRVKEFINRLFCQYKSKKSAMFSSKVILDQRQDSRHFWRGEYDSCGGLHQEPQKQTNKQTNLTNKTFKVWWIFDFEKKRHHFCKEPWGDFWFLGGSFLTETWKTPFSIISDSNALKAPNFIVHAACHLKTFCCCWVKLLEF